MKGGLNGPSTRTAVLWSSYQDSSAVVLLPGQQCCGPPTRTAVLCAVVLLPGQQCCVLWSFYQDSSAVVLLPGQQCCGPPTRTAVLWSFYQDSSAVVIWADCIFHRDFVHTVNQPISIG